MQRIGITGHSNISEDSVAVVASAIRSALRSIEAHELVGVTCLARGADQIFAWEVLECGGSIEVVLPAKDYRERKVKTSNLREFDDLISRARVVHVMPFETSNSEAYMAASEKVLTSVHRVIAVWDGQPSGGHGGTADVVAAARRQGLDVAIVWPSGASRT